MTNKSTSMAEAPCTVASTPFPIEHTDRGQAVWTTVAARRLGPIYDVILGYEQKNDNWWWLVDRVFAKNDSGYGK